MREPRTPALAERWILVVSWIALVFFALGGLWALIAPQTFFDLVASFPPYNQHLIHDIGAFQLGIAASLGAGMTGRTGLVVGLWGAAVGGLLHAVSHWVDADLGGRASDPIALTVLALLIVGALLWMEMKTKASVS